MLIRFLCFSVGFNIVLFTHNKFIDICFFIFSFVCCMNPKWDRVTLHIVWSLLLQWMKICRIVLFLFCKLSNTINIMCKQPIRPCSIATCRHYAQLVWSFWCYDECSLIFLNMFETCSADIKKCVKSFQIIRYTSWNIDIESLMTSLRICCASN